MSSAVFEKEKQFREAFASFETSTAKLADTARGGDLKAIREQFGMVVQDCKTCHNEFREK